MFPHRGRAQPDAFRLYLHKEGIYILRQVDFCNSQLVLTAWRYGRPYGGHLAALMIMGCINNRHRLGWGNLLEVIEHIPNFSATIAEPAPVYPNLWDDNFIRLLREVDGVVSGSATDYSKGALYWADLRYIDRPWFRTSILNEPEIHPRIVDMGSLCLFK